MAPSVRAWTTTRIAKSWALALLPCCAVASVEIRASGSCTLSGHKLDHLNGRYDFSKMVNGFQAFQSATGYKLYGLHHGRVAADLSGDQASDSDPPRYWVVSQSWNGNSETADEVIVVEPGKNTLSSVPKLSMCCTLATGSQCTNLNMQDYSSWLVLKNKPTTAQCSIQEDCSRRTEEENWILMLIIGIAAVLTLASTLAAACYCFKEPPKKAAPVAQQQSISIFPSNSLSWTQPASNVAAGEPFSGELPPEGDHPTVVGIPCEETV